MRPKKTPVTTDKKETSSSSAPKKQTRMKQAPKASSGSYLDIRDKVFTVGSSANPGHSSFPDLILTFLQRIKNTNQNISKNMEGLKCHDSVSSTPVNSPNVQPTVDADFTLSLLLSRSKCLD